MCVLESGSTYLVGMYKSLGKKKCSPAAFFYSEDGGSSFFFRNASKFVGDYTVSHWEIKLSKILSICKFE
jgi:hypothetical protein